MTDPIGRLLDEAVADVRPRDPDPLATITRRGRARRHLTLTAAATSVLATACGVAALTWPQPRAVDGAGDGPPLPYVDGGQVVAGTLRFTIPAGWRVVTAAAGSDCRDLAHTIRIRTADLGACGNAPVEVYGTANPNGDTGTVVVDEVLQGHTGYYRPPVAFTVPGGQPGWSLVSAPGQGTDAIVFPWARVSLDFNTDDATARQILGSLRGETVPPAGLDLPSGPHHATLTVPAGFPAPHTVALTDQTKIDAVTDLLRRQRPTAQDAACASTGQRTARLTLSAAPPAERPLSTLATVRPELSRDAAPGPPEQAIVVTAGASPPPADTSPPPTGVSVLPTDWPTLQTMEPQHRPTPPVPADSTSVVISLGDDCRQAVSARGGRVDLDDAAVTALKRLFGIAS